MRCAIAAFFLLALSCSGGDAAAREDERDALSFARSETAAPATIRLSSAAFAEGGRIPDRHSGYGGGLSPALNWSALPPAAKSLVLIMEDPDASSAKPYVHWLAWNIDPALSGLPEAIPPGGEIQSPVRLNQGRNTRGKPAYFGPRPPGSKPHRYHFELFALDTRLTLRPGADRTALLAAMKGHVIAKGETIGLYARS